MSVALVLISDGRDRYTEECVQSLWRLKGCFSHVRLVDDSGGESGLGWAESWEVISHPARRGLAAAVQSGWADLPADVGYVFHLETDFVIVDPVDVDEMADTLDANPMLAQLVLKRQPWSPEECQAGGIIECHPEDYTTRPGWVEHKRIFSLNPCLIPRRVVDMGWPAGNEAEQTERLVGEGWRFGFWGARHDPPVVLHIGAERAPGWKL